MNSGGYFFGTKPAATFALLLDRFTGKRLQSPYRSTVPLLSLVEHDRPAWESLLQACGASGNEAIHFEFCVASPKKGGNPSQTDAMVRAADRVLAIEAKWTEPCDRQTVEKRIARGEKDGADPSETIDGWLAHLRPFAANALVVDHFNALGYQTLHRAASACAEAARTGLKPEVVYLHFSSSRLPKNAATAEMYTQELGKLQALLGSPCRVGLRVVDMPIVPTTLFEDIEDADRHSAATSAKVRDALCRGPLFSFGKPSIVRI